MTFEQLRDLFLIRTPEIREMPIAAVEELLREAILETQLLNLPALTDYYTTHYDSSSIGDGISVIYKGIVIKEKIYALPNNVLFGIENPILAIKYSTAMPSGELITISKFSKLSPSEYSGRLSNMMNLSATSPIYTITNNQIRVFPMESNINLGIVYIRKADVNALNVDLPDNYIPDVINNALSLLIIDSKFAAQKNYERLKVTLDTSERLQNKEVSDDIKRT